MSVADRWHKTRPEPGEEPCRKHKLVPSAEHGRGDRWQVRWRDENGKQKSQNFRLREGRNPALHADAFDAQVQASLDADTYIDPAAAKVTFQAYAERWRTSRVHSAATAARIEREFRIHAYPGPATPGRTPGGGPSIGQHQIGALAKSPSLLQAWIRGIPLGANSARLVILDVGQVFTAAVDDGRISRNPLAARSVQKPERVKRLAAAWTAEQVLAIEAELPDEVSAMAPLGASCGHRQGELCGAAVEDLDFLRKMIHVEWQVLYHKKKLYFAPLKNRNVRDVPVCDYAVLAVSEHLRHRPAAAVTLPVLNPDGTTGKPVTRRLIFTRPDGQAHSFNTLNWHWNRARERAGIPYAEHFSGMHVLRHTAASAWLSDGLSLAKTAALLGDTKEVVLATYAHFMPSDDDRARGIMNGFLVAPGAPSAQNVPSAGVPGTG